MADDPIPEDEVDDSGTDVLGLITRFLKQQSTQQGLNVICGIIATRLGVQANDMILLCGLVTGFLLVFHDERKRDKKVATEVIRTAEEAPIKATVKVEPVVIENKISGDADDVLHATVQLEKTNPEDRPS